MFRPLVRILFLLMLAAAQTTAAVWAQPEAVAPEARADMLAGMIDELRQKNPQLQAARAAARMARNQAGVAGNLSAPMVGVDFYNAPASSFPDPLKDQMEIDYFAQQEIMFPGKLAAMATAENRRADMLELEAQTLGLRLIRNLKSAYYELYEVDQRLEINRENQVLVRQLQEITRKQYELGMGNQSDVLRAQTELSSLESAAYVLRQERRSMEAELNALLNRSADSPVPVITVQAPVPTEFQRSRLLPLAENHQPEIAGARSGIAMARAEKGAAFWSFFPDLMVRGMYKDMRAMNEEDSWSLMAGITLPIAPWTVPKYVSGYQKSLAGVDQAASQFEQARNMVRAALEQSLARVEAGQAVVRLNRTTIVPQAEQTLNATLAAYQTGKRDFMTLLDAYRMVWMARENLVMAVKNVLVSLADLEQAVGLSLPEINAALKTKE